MSARDDLHAAFVDAMQDGNWHMTADEDHAKATAMVDAAIAEALQAAAKQAEQALQRVREFADRDQDGLCCSHVAGDLRRLLDAT